MDIIAGSGNDEFYTPAYAIEPLLKYIPFGSTIWCPFDTDESIFVKKLKLDGHIVLHSHISMENGDFFKYKPSQKIDYIISNPPYSMKNQVFERLFNLKIPFAMLVGVVGIFESEKRFNLFKGNKFEIMYFDKRVSYLKNYSDKKAALNPPFSSVYICQNVLPNTIVFEKLIKNIL